MAKRPKSSLLDKVAAEQAAAPSLFSVDTEEAGTSNMDRCGEFTAERLMERRPAIYKAIIEGYAQGLGIRQLCRAYAVSHHTVAAVIGREPASVATHKEEFVARGMMFKRMALDRLIDEINDIPIQSLPVAYGIVSDKLALDSGGATSRIEHIDGPTHDDYMKLITGQVIEAEILPATGLEGGTDSLKGMAEAIEVQAETVEVQAGALEVVPAALLPGESFPGTIPTGSHEITRSSDEQSGGLVAAYSVGSEGATPSDTLPAGLKPHIEGSKRILGHPESSEIKQAGPATRKRKASSAAGSTGNRASKSKRTEGGRGSQKSAAVSRGH